uniref:C6 transcription factor n=1 Tax=Colletotrichum fructicola (strain Nara gc5) TaxID=1213859 RepID=L2GBL3_COLFN
MDGFGAGLDADGDGPYARRCCDDGRGRHRGRVVDGGECEYDARGLETLTSKIEDGLNCIKHAVPCDFLQSQRQSSASSLPRSPGGTESQGPSNGTHGGSIPGFGGGGGVDDLSLNLIDLELMHNFTTFAYTTLSTDPVVRQMWKVPVVRLALECDYVMRALLSVSALHLAHHRPERRDFFISRALTYHQMASRTAMGLMGALDGENCEKLYLFSVLTIFFALACPRKSSDSLIMGESSFPDWLFLLRGTRGLLKILDPRAYTGPLLPMFTHGRERYMHTRDESKIQSDLLADLQRLVNKTCANPELLPVYNHAIDELRRTLSVFLWDGGRGMDITDAFVWKYLMAEDFLPLLKSPGATQEAVAIFSHFCILLKRLERVVAAGMGYASDIEGVDVVGPGSSALDPVAD